MEKLATKKIEKESHSYEIEIYENFALVTIFLPMNVYSDVVESAGFGNYDIERILINQFVKKLLQEEFNGLTFFGNKDIFYSYLSQKGLKTETTNNNGWFKSAVFELGEFDRDLERVINYLNSQSEKFERGSKSGKIKIADSFLNKLK